MMLSAYVERLLCRSLCISINSFVVLFYKAPAET